jgi:protein required for attachment to host cells
MQNDPLTIQRRKPVTWILVADGGHGQVFIPGREEHFVPLPGNANNHHYREKQVDALEAVADMHFEAESRREYDVTQKDRGTVFESAVPGRHAYSPKLEVGEEIKRHMAKKMAEKLNEAAQQKRFERLVLVLPPQMLGLIKEELSPATKNMVIAELAKDLARFDSAAIAEHIKDIA